MNNDDLRGIVETDLSQITKLADCFDVTVHTNRIKSVKQNKNCYYFNLL